MSRKKIEPSPWAKPDPNALESPKIPLDVETPARPATSDELGTPKSGSRQLVNLCAKLGLTTEATYARGPYLGANGDPLRVSDSLVIRVYEPGGRQIAAATWIDQAFEHAYVRSGSPTCRRIGANDLKSTLKEIYT